MLAYIKGILAFKDTETAIIEAGGIGYEISMSSHALASLPSTGSPAQVWTHLQVKDDGWSLFGFSDSAEKEMFIRLIGVSGIGPKMALAALSTYRPSELGSYIAASDITAISNVPGIGKKTAQRIVLELQGVLKAEDASAGQSAQGSAGLRDATAALQSMGFSVEEITAALKGCSADDTSAIVRYALKNLGGRL